MKANDISQNNSLSNLEGLIRKTKEAVQNSSKEISEIVNDTRSKIHKLRDELIEVRARLANIIVLVDSLESELNSCRALANSYNELHGKKSEDSQRVYEQISSINSSIEEARRAEKNLNLRRNNIERYLKENGELLVRSEKVLKQVMIALEYLDISELPDKDDSAVVRIIEAQDSEKERLSRDIHDGPAQALVGIMLRAEIAEKLIGSSPNKLRSELKQIQISVRETLADIRQIIFDLMPYTMEKHGLVKTLRNLVKDNKKINIALAIDEEAEISSKAIETNVFRIIQELYSNVVKHSKTKDATISLKIDEKNIKIIVSDEGVGFDTKTHKGGYGLISVADRVELLRGEYDVSSSSKGTKFEILVPNTKNISKNKQNKDIKKQSKGDNK